MIQTIMHSDRVNELFRPDAPDTSVLYLDSKPIAYKKQGEQALVFLAYDRVDETDDAYWRNQLHPLIKNWAGPNGIVLSTGVCGVDSKHNKLMGRGGTCAIK